jgi:hypothetical protein
MSGTGVVLKLNFQEPGAAKICQLSANRSCLETGISRNRSWKAGRASRSRAALETCAVRRQEVTDK